MSPRTIYRFFVIAAVGCHTVGCANFSSFQTADTVPKQQGRGGVGVSYTGYQVEDETFAVPAVNLWYRYGITDKLEAHTLVWVPFGATIGLKYQVVGQANKPGMSLSLGADVGYLEVSASSLSGSDVTQRWIDTYLPVYLGYRKSHGLAFYGGPKYLLRAISSNGGDNDFQQLAAATVGVAIGERTRIHLEGSVIFAIAGDVDPILNGGVGLSF